MPDNSPNSHQRAAAHSASPRFSTDRGPSRTISRIPSFSAAQALTTSLTQAKTIASSVEEQRITYMPIQRTSASSVQRLERSTTSALPERHDPRQRPTKLFLIRALHRRGPPRRECPLSTMFQRSRRKCFRNRKTAWVEGARYRVRCPMSSKHQCPQKLLHHPPPYRALCGHRSLR